MARLSKQEWIEAGFAILARAGTDALTIDALSKRLRVTKGSFYHHFPNMRGYQEALLEHWRVALTGAVIEAAEPAGSAEAILDRIVAHMVSLSDSDDPEHAIRNWASREEWVAEVVRGVDAERLTYGARLLREAAGGPSRAVLMSRVLYALMLGASQIRGMEGSGWDEIYREFKRWAGFDPGEGESEARGRRRARR